MQNRIICFFLFSLFLTRSWALEPKLLLESIQNETQLKVDEHLSILANITEERNPNVVHALCVAHNQTGKLSYVLNFDTHLSELSYIDELGSSILSNKQFWTIENFFQSTEMVAFFGTSALKGRILNSNIVLDGMNGVELSYLYTLSQYKQKVFYLSHKEGRWRLYHKVQNDFKPVKSLFVKGKKNLFGFITGIEDIVPTLH